MTLGNPLRIDNMPVAMFVTLPSSPTILKAPLLDRGIQEEYSYSSWSFEDKSTSLN